MNVFIGIGNLASDPVLRQTENGKDMCSFRLAVNSGWGEQKRTAFLHIVTFGKRAETCAKYLSKGRKVGVRGFITTGEYTNKEGRKVYTTDIMADEVEFLPNGEKSDSAQKQEATAKEDFVPEGFESIDDDFIPF